MDLMTGYIMITLFLLSVQSLTVSATLQLLSNLVFHRAAQGKSIGYRRYLESCPIAHGFTSGRLCFQRSAYRPTLV